MTSGEDIPHAVFSEFSAVSPVAARRQLPCLEMLYVEALLACGQEENASHYLKEEWSSRCNALGYRRLSLSLEAHDAYREGDIALCRGILKKGGSSFQRNAIFSARLDWLEGRKEEAVGRLQNAETSICYEQVMIWSEVYYDKR